MIVTPSGTFPLVGRRRSTIFTAPGLTNVARARIAPVQPRTALVAVPQTAVGGLAQLWRGLTLTEQLTWELSSIGLVAAYNWFVKMNTPVIQWGLDYFRTYPGTYPNAELDIAAIYAEPDGVHMTLAMIATDPIPDPTPSWLRLYIKPWGNILSAAGDKLPYQFLGSYPFYNGPVQQFIDITDDWLRLAGQWWHPYQYGTVVENYCGNWIDGSYYTTDATGAFDPLGGNPYVYGGFGIQPYIVGANNCPVGTTPPYPWPPSH